MMLKLIIIRSDYCSRVFRNDFMILMFKIILKWFWFEIILSNSYFDFDLISFSCWFWFQILLKKIWPNSAYICFALTCCWTFSPKIWFRLFLVLYSALLIPAEWYKNLAEKNNWHMFGSLAGEWRYKNVRNQLALLDGAARCKRRRRASVSGRSVFFSFDATAQQRLDRYSPYLQKKTSLWCCSLMVVSHENPSPKWGLNTSIFGSEN